MPNACANPIEATGVRKYLDGSVDESTVDTASIMWLDVHDRRDHDDSLMIGAG
jgi:hypothetical protein